MPPLTKTCPKMVLPIKGVAFVSKTFLQKNFWCRERIPLAARSQFFGNTLLKSKLTNYCWGLPLIIIISAAIRPSVNPSVNASYACRS
jgi:hypothetical protein